MLPRRATDGHEIGFLMVISPERQWSLSVLSRPFARQREKLSVRPPNRLEEALAGHRDSRLSDRSARQYLETPSDPVPPTMRQDSHSTICRPVRRVHNINLSEKRGNASTGVDAM